ncbi:MAG: hypothetical protein Q8R36_04480 [bacterium]|nr:hypothetical protein [bacterium]
MSEEKEGRIERLKKVLYRPITGVIKEKRFTLHPHEKEAGDTWQHQEESIREPYQSPSRMSFSKKLFITSLVFFTGALLIASFVLLGNSNLVSTRNVDILVSGPVATQAGEELKLQVVIENKNSVALESVDFLVEYPEGARGLGNLERELSRLRKSLGRIEPGGIIKEPIQAVLFGQEGDEKKFTIAIEYRVADSNAIFVKEKEYVALVSSSATSLSAKTLSEVVPGQEFSIEITLTSNADIVTRNLLVDVEYPFGFSFVEGTPKPLTGNTVWTIGDLPPKGKRIITIRGIIEGQDGEQKVFRISSGAKKDGEDNTLGIIYNKSIAEVKVVRPFLSVLLFVNGEALSEYVAESRNLIDVDIVWVNNLPTKIVNGKIVAKLSGEVINKLSVQPRGGFYNSADNTIVWDKNSLPELEDIESGAQGQTNFRFSLVPLFTTNGLLLRDPTVSISLNTSGNRVSASGVSEEIKNSVERKIKITSDVAFASRAVYFVGPFQNTGPLPPEIERETTYTILWTAVNSSNHVSRATVKTILPPYVRWIGFTTPQKENISFNDTSREVTWEISRLSAGEGVTLPPREVAFQVGLTPSISQLGQTPTIIGQTTFSGADEFTGATIRFVEKALTILLSTDPSFGFTQGKVVPQQVSPSPTAP